MGTVLGGGGGGGGGRSSRRGAVGGKGHREGQEGAGLLGGV